MNASLLPLALGAGIAVLFVKMRSGSSAPTPASLPTSSGSLWPASTFAAAPGSPSSQVAPAVGSVAALQDTLHRGGDGSIILAEVQGEGHGIVRAVLATGPQTSPIRTGDIVLFDPSEVLMVAPNLGTFMNLLSQL